jgi:iron complex outermembrane recepter protein
MQSWEGGWAADWVANAISRGTTAKAVAARGMTCSLIIGVAGAIFAPSARGQMALPEIVVTAPSPIVRRPAVQTTQPAPSEQPPAASAQPAALPEVLPGTLQIVADQFATVTVVPNEELRRTPGATLGDILFAKPGITASTFAPGSASRPVVRGLDNYRVRIQENGLAVNDVSDLSEDHQVPIDPLAARRVEVIRGPATLRWGSQAIGGVVNVENDRIPTALPLRPIMLETIASFTTVDKGREGGMLVDAGYGNFAFHADAFGRAASDYRIPSYPYLFEPSLPFTGFQSNSAAKANGQSVGGSYVFANGFVGVSVSRFDSFYRIPGVEAAETNTRIDLNQTKVNSKGEFRLQAGMIDAVRFWAGASDYKHDELANEGGFDGIQQTFTNRGQEGRVEVQLLPFDLRFAALTTAVGVQASHQSLAAPGADPGPFSGLFDPNKTSSAAAYVFNELAFNATQRLQIAGRIEHVDVRGIATFFPPDLLGGVDPTQASANPDFTPKSASIGFLQNLPWDLVASITGQYVERAPRAPELFSRGPHEATATFEIGDPNLTIEAARTIEVGLRRATGPFRFEATAFYTRFDNFIFKRLTGIQCGEDFASCGVEDELNQIVYSQRDATFRGAELQAQLDIAPVWTGIFGVEGQFDTVRATFTDGSNVPRIPPVRAGGGVFWRNANWLARVNLLHAFEQDRIGDNETPTDGYNLLRAELSYTTRLRPTHFGSLEQVTVGISGNNLLNEDIRNHVSFKKDEVLLPGRNFKLFANLRF